MPTTSLFSPFRRIHQGVVSISEVPALLSRHDSAPMSSRRFTGILHAGEWFELDENAARSMASPFNATIRPGGTASLPARRQEQIRSVLFSLLTNEWERWFHGFVSLTDPVITTATMRAAIVARESSDQGADMRQERLELIWNMTDARGYADDIWPPGNEGFRTILIHKAGCRPVLKLLAHLSGDEINRLIGDS